MATASALFTTVELKEELSFGVKDTDTDGAILLNRIQFNPKLDQSIIESAEIKRSMQSANYDRGVKSATATLSGELEAGAYKALWAALLRQEFNSGIVTDLTATDISSAIHTPNITSVSSLAALDLEAGDEINFTGFTGGNKSNCNGRKFIVIAATTNSITVRSKYGNYVMFADAAGEGVTITNKGTASSPKDTSIYSGTPGGGIAAVADTAVFSTVAGDFTTKFAAGDTVKVTGQTGTNADNNGKPFKLLKVTAAGLFGFYTDGSVPIADAAAESVTVTKDDSVKITYSSTNLLEVATATQLEITLGSFIAEGFKVHDVIRLVGFPTATNNNRNLLIKSFSTDGKLLNFAVLDGDSTAMVVESAGSGDYVYRVGKKTFIPQENHTNKSFMAEKWFSDTTQSEQYTGLRVGTAKISAANSAIPKVDFDFIGKDLETAQAHYYTSSAEPDASGNLSTIFGAAYVGNVSVGSVTAFDLSIMANLSALDKCIGSDTTTNVVAGIYKVSGSMTLYFQDEVMRDHFLDKDELSQVFILRESDAYDADFIAFQLPRVVYNSAALTDDVKASILTIPFTAFENPNGDDGAEKSKLMSMISIQDSKA